MQTAPRPKQHAVLCTFLLHLEDIPLIERVLSTGKEYHSVTPAAEEFPTGGILFHPEVHNRICAIIDGPSCTRTPSRGPTNAQVRQSHYHCRPVCVNPCPCQSNDQVGCNAENCKFQLRLFAYTRLDALAPTLLHRNAGKGVGRRVGCGEEIMDDPVFELSAEVFWGPWLVSDPASMQAVSICLNEVMRRMLILFAAQHGWSVEGRLGEGQG